MNWQTTIAGIALLVSVGTAIFSYNVDKGSQQRQRDFEISMVKMQSLESAKKDISLISSQLNRKLNAGIIALENEFNTVDISKDIFESYSAAVDVFNAVEHNLNLSNTQIFNSRITEYETTIFKALKDGMEPTADQILALSHIPSELENMIDEEIEHLQSNMVTD